MEVLTVVGHNNRFESVVVLGDMVVTGHNNVFMGLGLAKPVQDQGVNNKFHNCYSITIASSGAAG